MGYKRLRHAADILCQMFCGWRLINSYYDLERLGPGTVSIDALTEACSFNGQPIPPLQIAAELRAWLHQDLPQHGIEIAALTEASLTAELRFGTVAKADRVTGAIHFTPDDGMVVPPIFVSCHIDCRSRVATADRVFTSSLRDVEEWPAGWPEAKTP
jgi:hypothetical protein